MWPHSSGDVPDTKRLKLVLIDPSHLYGSKGTTEFLDDIYTNYSSGYRTYKNNVLFLLLGKDEYEGVRRSIRRILALRAIKEDHFIMQTLSEENKKTLQMKLKESQQDVEVKLTSSYNYLMKGGSSSTPFSLGIPPVGDRPNLSKRVYERLREEDVLLDKIGPKTILDKVFSQEDDKKTIKDIWESFFRYAQLPILVNENVLKNAISQGVKGSVFGLMIDDMAYFDEDLPDSAYLEESFIIRPELAKKLKDPDVPVESPTRTHIPTVEGGAVIITTPETGQTSKYRSVNLSFSTPWDKLSEVMTGVVRPLIQGWCGSFDQDRARSKIRKWNKQGHN